MNIKIQEVRYFGYLQGHKVWIDGVKYPREHGYVYTGGFKDLQKPVNHAIEASGVK